MRFAVSLYMATRDRIAGFRGRGWSQRSTRCMALRARSGTPMCPETLAGYRSARPHRAAAQPGGAVLPPHRHHLRRLWRGGGDRAADPVRHHSPRPHQAGMAAACRRGLEQRVNALNAFLDDVYGRARVPEGRRSSRDDLVYRNAGFRPEMAGRTVAARHLRPYRRHRHRARRRRRRSMCSRTTPARRPASPTCWRTAK